MKKSCLVYVTLISVFLVAFLAGCGTAAPSREPGESPPSAAGQPPGAGSTALIKDNPQPVAEDEQDGSPSLSAGFLFKVRGFDIRMGEPAAPVVEALGEPMNYFEAPSCAFNGVDKIYYYSGFELYTYPVGEDDFILSIILTDDSVSTSEGIYIGMTYNDMTSAYGGDHTQNFGQYTYTLDDSALSFLIEDDLITVITYNYDYISHNLPGTP